LKEPASGLILDGRQAVKLLRRRKVLIDVFGEVQLFLFNHVHEFNACERPRGGVHFPETPHGRSDTFDMG